MAGVEALLSAVSCRLMHVQADSPAIQLFGGSGQAECDCDKGRVDIPGLSLYHRSLPIPSIITSNPLRQLHLTRPPKLASIPRITLKHSLLNRRSASDPASLNSGPATSSFNLLTARPQAFLEHSLLRVAPPSDPSPVRSIATVFDQTKASRLVHSHLFR